MVPAFETRGVTKLYGAEAALERVTVAVEPGSVVGLIGKNGSGKTTLLNLVTGLVVPTSGEVRTLGGESRELDDATLAEIGYAQQEGRFIEWMTVARHLAYVASFYPRWDRSLQQRLSEELELDNEQDAVVAALSPGNRQKLGLVLAVCHRPRLILLDEPMASLDPIARRRVLEHLLGMVREESSTIVISSHALTDLEKVVDTVICLDRGRLGFAGSLDHLQESYAEWLLTRRGGALPASFAEPFVLRQEVNGQRARLLVRTVEAEAATFALRHGVEVEARPLRLEEVFPLLVGEEGR